MTAPYQSPWAHRSAERKQAALLYRDIRNELGKEVREVQQESFGLYEQAHNQESQAHPRIGNRSE